MSEPTVPAASPSHPLMAAAIGALRPRPVQEIWDWATANLRPPRHGAYISGTSLTMLPYQRGEWSPLWAWRRYVDVLMLWAAQSGKTTALQAMLGYAIACDPGPMLIVYPTQSTAKRRSTNHLQPMIRDNPCLAQYLTPSRHDFSKLSYSLKHCSVNLAWAGSPSELASEPIKHLFKDELGKFPRESDDEAPAEELADQRTKAFGEFAHRIGCTTPTLITGPGWRDWRDSTRCQFHVPCPQCHTAQPLYFSDLDRRVFVGDGSPFTGGVRWPREPGIGKEEAAAAAWYECPHCHVHLTDWHLKRAIAAGQWVPANRHAARYACQLSSLYAPAVTLKYLVLDWWKCYRDPGARHDFMNSELSIPYEPLAERLELTTLKSHLDATLRPGVCPAPAVALLLTADVMTSHIRFRVRAWAADLTSWGLLQGHVPPLLLSNGEQSPNWAGLEKIRALLWQRADGSGPVGISATLVDAGYETSQVYQYALAHAGEVWPAFGRDSGQLKDLIRYTAEAVLADPAAGLPLGGTIQRVVHANDTFKDRLSNALKIPREAPGYWAVEPAVDDSYWSQMQGEEKREAKDSRGRVTYTWVRVGDNHAFDCEVLQLVAAHVFQVSAMGLPESPGAAPTESTVNPYTHRQT